MTNGRNNHSRTEYSCYLPLLYCGESSLVPKISVQKDKSALFLTFPAAGLFLSASSWESQMVCLTPAEITTSGTHGL